MKNILTTCAAFIGGAGLGLLIDPMPSIPKVEPEVIEIPVVQYQESIWECEKCTPEEKYILKELQSRTNITDKNALATILGNIKQESNFVANICEGGSRVPYADCHRGGYGIIQWTTEARYNGLGSFASAYNCDPSTLECQTRYMINEYSFQRVLEDFENDGQSVHQYMVPSYYWLGWGIKGKRELYANEYVEMMSNV